MKAVAQRAANAVVTVKSKPAGEIGAGLCVFLGVEKGDTADDVRKLAGRIARLRVFEDGSGKLGLSLLDTGGGALVIPNFTLCGDCRKGHRPDFAGAAPFGPAKELFEAFCDALRGEGIQNVQAGVFGADMGVGVLNDGPVTILLDTRTFP